jgi:hypothetical protein
MACCALVLRLLAYVFDRLGLDGDRLGAQSIRRVPIVPLLALMVPEIALSLLLVRSPAWAEHQHVAHHDQSMNMPQQMSHGIAPGGADMASLAGSLVAAAVVAVLTVVAARRFHSRISSAAGVGLAILTAGIAASPAMDGSHLITMIVLESCLVLSPLCLIGIKLTPGPADDVWVVVRGFMALLTGLVAISLIYLVHAAPISSALVTASGARWWVAALGLAVGAAFWASLLRFRLPPVFRQLVLFAVLEAGSVLGLTMLLAPAPSFIAVTDQRMAGLFMMAVDIGVLIVFAQRESAWEWRRQFATRAV